MKDIDVYIHEIMLLQFRHPVHKKTALKRLYIEQQYSLRTMMCVGITHVQ